MKDCIFCQIIRKEVRVYTVYEDISTIAFLDKYPVSQGHIQLAPKTHYRWIYEMAEIGNFFETAQRIIRGIIPALGADHVTLATHGHEIYHAHLWIVPHYTNKTHVVGEWEGREIADEKMSKLAHMLRNTILGGGVS